MQFLSSSVRYFQAAIVSAIALVTIPAQSIAQAIAQANPRLCPAQLQQEVDAIAKSSKLQPSRVGVFVQTF